MEELFSSYLCVNTTTAWTPARGIYRHPIWTPGHVHPLLHFPFSSLFVAWESNRGWPKAFGHCTHMGDLEESPGSWLQIGLDLGSESTDKGPLSLPPLSVNLTFQ